MSSVGLIWLLLVSSLLVAAAEEPEPMPRSAASRAAIERDWMLQDYMSVLLPAALEAEKQQWREKFVTARESKADPPVLRHLACFLSPTDAAVEQRMVAQVLKEVPNRQALAEELEKLTASRVPGIDPRWKALYLQSCEARRHVRLKTLVERFTEFVFILSPQVKNSWKYTEVLSDPQTDRHRDYRPGSSLNRLRIEGLYGTVRPLIEDQNGIVRNPDVSFDGRTILFSWKQSDRGDDYHLYELAVNGGDVHQITHGAGLADYEGVYMPDGNIVFSSTRCSQTVDCNWVEVSNLYLTDPAGSFVRRIGFDQVHTIFPTLSDDGRVLYTRWEYNDRGQIFPQPLFQMNPDGTNQRELYGGNSWFPTNIIHARKIPNSRKILAVITGHHRPAQGKLALIDPGVGRQEGRGVQLIAPLRETEYLQIDRYALDGNQFQYPYPIDERHFLVSLSLPEPEGGEGPFQTYYMDIEGRRELLVEGPESGAGVGCRQIVPLAPRPRPHVRPRFVSNSRATNEIDSGVVYLQDIYAGSGLPGIPRGTIRSLRVVALEYRAAAIGRTQQQGLGGFSEVTTPISVANGSWDVKVVLGSAPVYEDGSACFEVPANVPIYFQALNEDNYVVQTMRSWTTLMPGEHQSCVGCHEHKNTTPRADLGASLALKAGPTKLMPFYGPPRGFSFAGEVQPILDQHCTRCHDGREEVPCDLRGDMVVIEEMKRRFSRSYLALTHTRGSTGDWTHPLVNWIDCMSEPEMLPPYHRGSATSGLMKLLAEGHEQIQLSREEMDKIACWIDLLVPFCGDYREANAWSRDELAFYQRAEDKRQRLRRTESSVSRESGPDSCFKEHSRAD